MFNDLGRSGGWDTNGDRKRTKRAETGWGAAKAIRPGIRFQKLKVE
jgi:hypothetical protein